MDESGKDGAVIPFSKEQAIEELADKLEVLAEHDPEKYIHNPVYFLSYDKGSDQPTRKIVGNIFKVGEDNMFVVIINEHQKKRIFVISPKDAPGAEDEQELEDFYNFIGFNRNDAVGHFGEDFSYSSATLTYQDQATFKTTTHANLSNYFEDNGMLVARSDVNQQETVSRKLALAFEHSKKVLQLPEGKW